MNKELINDPLADLEEVKSNWITWGKIGDYIRGTFTSKSLEPNKMKGKEGTMQNVYEILAEVGNFHDIDENKIVSEKPIIIGKGEFYKIGGKKGIDEQFRNIKIGQIIGLRYAEDIPSKTRGNNPYKNVKVRSGGMDPNFNGQASGLMEDEKQIKID